LLDKELLSILACPSCVGVLHYEPGRARLVCASCRVSYTIEDEIPVLLKEEARPLEPEWRPEPGEVR
jgi:LSD1 subclass zinc finger protein